MQQVKWCFVPYMLLVGLLLLNSGVSWANPTSCEGLFKKRNYSQAAKCFRSKALKMKTGALLGVFEKLQKGRYFKNASLAFRKAATLEQNVARASFLYEEAANTLSLYLKDGLCRKRYRCKKVEKSQKDILKKVGYARLSLVIQEKVARVEVKGYRYDLSKRVPPSWSEQIRPGTYLIKILFDGEEKPVFTKVVVLAGKDQIHTFRPVPKKRLVPKVKKLPKTIEPEKKRVVALNEKPIEPSNSDEMKTAMWILFGVGIASVAGGTTFTAIAYSRAQKSHKSMQGLKDIGQKSHGLSRRKRAELALSNRDLIEKSAFARSEHDRAFTESVVGYVLFGVGGISLAVGLGVFLSEGKIIPASTTIKKPFPTEKTPSKASTHSLLVPTTSF